jgi:hypothetical protein
MEEFWVKAEWLFARLLRLRLFLTTQALQFSL